MLMLLVIWFMTGALLVYTSCRQRAATGLPLAYFAGLSLIHVPGALLYVNTEDFGSSADMTRLGFEMTVIGLISFVAGVLGGRYLEGSAGARHLRERSLSFSTTNLKRTNRLVRAYVFIGFCVYFIGLPLASSIPSATSVLSPLGSLIVLGACVGLSLAIDYKDRRKTWMFIALIPTLPLTTTLVGGFAGFGTYWAITIAAFLFVRSRNKSIYLLLAPVMAFLGLSIFVNYMAARGEIRQLVWYEQADIGERLDRVLRVARDFEWLDLADWRHRDAIDSRLNQNLLVGLVVGRLGSGEVEYGYGSTIGGLSVFIPRLLWPDKPDVGGGGSVVRDFTGIKFSEGTSVGAGQVLEFYANFGLVGVIGGFLLYGWLMGRLDLNAGRSLQRGDQRGFLLSFLPGLSLLQPGGNLREIVISALSSVMAGYIIGQVLRNRGLGTDASGLPQGRS